MIPIVVAWTEYTATVNGRILKLVPCENCSTEYVYVLEREASGVGTSVYGIFAESAQSHSESAADDTLQSYLENDFDPVPCPVCGHYQRFMFSKLQETKSPLVPAAMFAVLLIGCLDSVAALNWSINYLQRPSDHAVEMMLLTWSILLLVCAIGFGLRHIKRAQDRRFDPNLLEQEQARIAKGRSRAITRTEFDRTRETERGVDAAS